MRRAEAVERGLEVLVIERSSGGGGASATSEGIFYLGGGTALQEACGYEDTPEQMYAFLRASTSCPDDERLRVLRRSEQSFRLAGTPWCPV